MGTAPQRPGSVPGDGMVGRRRELDALRSWLEAAHDGRGRLVISVGEPGIGKTRLAQELAGSALAMGATVVWGRCVEAEGAPAYWPWTQVLRALSVDPDAVLGGGGQTPEDRFRLFDEVTAIVRRAADGASGRTARRPGGAVRREGRRRQAPGQQAPRSPRRTPTGSSPRRSGPCSLERPAPSHGVRSTRWGWTSRGTTCAPTSGE